MNAVSAIYCDFRLSNMPNNSLIKRLNVGNIGENFRKIDLFAAA